MTTAGPRFGRVRPAPLGPHFRLRNYLRATLPDPPQSCDYSGPAKSILSDIMGNDQLGDCVIAAGYHVVGVETANAGSQYHATLAQVISDYSATGGYVPGNPSTDGGVDEITALNYWQQTGFANGTKLLGWLTVNCTNVSEVKSALFLFENLFFGIELPDAWINPFPSGDGFVWDDGVPNPQNGHAVMGCGYDARGVLIDTWGMLGILTWKAIANLCTPAAGGMLTVMLTPDQLSKGQQKAPNGVAWTDLVADFDSMGGTVPVPPTPIPTPPPPDPASPVTLAEAMAWSVAALQAAHPLMTRGQAESIVKEALATNWRGT